jgi:hypothetical protein
MRVFPDMVVMMVAVFFFVFFFFLQVRASGIRYVTGVSTTRGGLTFATLCKMK